jgi:hypothetical protein
VNGERYSHNTLHIRNFQDTMLASSLLWHKFSNDTCFLQAFFSIMIPRMEIRKSKFNSLVNMCVWSVCMVCTCMRLCVHIKYEGICVIMLDNFVKHVISLHGYYNLVFVLKQEIVMPFKTEGKNLNAHSYPVFECMSNTFLGTHPVH